MEFIGLIFVLVLVVVVMLFRGRRQPQPESESSDSGDYGHLYRRMPTLMSEAEWSFYRVLGRVLDKDWLIFSKVRVLDVIDTKKGLSKSDWSIAFNKISRKHFDFVICDPSGSAIKAVVELDDSSHKKKSRRARDEFLDGLCGHFDLPILHFEVREAYVLDDVRRQFEEVLFNAPDRPTLPPLDMDSPSQEPKCPKCGSSMVRQTAKAGKNTGKQFWGCSNFPNCRGIVPID